MKIVLYAFIAIFIFGILQPAFTNKAVNSNSIVLQATDSLVSIQQLELSAKIISGRLTDFNSEKFEVILLRGKRQIAIQATNFHDLKKVEKLLVQKGALAFYETYDRKSLEDRLSIDNKLFTFFRNSEATSTNAKIGCVTAREAGVINDYLGNLGMLKGCKFVWDQPFEEPDVCLYALKTDGEKGALIVGSDIESVTTNQEKASQIQEISITLKKEAVKVWANATRRNINHAIAIVLDDKVLAAPVVRSVIEGGKCSITGNYTADEARWIAAIGNNGELPLNFTVVK